MKYKALSLLAAGLLSGVLFCNQAQAILITGSIEMGGKATLDNANLGSATKATVVTGSSVQLADGTFTGTDDTGVTWNTPFAWNPPNTPIDNLWSFTFDGKTYAFDLTTVTIVSQSSSFLNLTGVGVLQISGGLYDDTAGDFSFTITDTGGPNANMKFFFGASTSAVPDGGLTIALLGSALVGLGLLRRKLS